MPGKTYEEQLREDMYYYEDTRTEYYERHVPYYNTHTLAVAGDTHTEYVQDDTEQGLGVVGRSGWINNFGPGDLDVEINDGEYTQTIRILAGTGIEIEHEDSTGVKKAMFTAVAAGTDYEICIARGEPSTVDAIDRLGRLVLSLQRTMEAQK